MIKIKIFLDCCDVATLEERINDWLANIANIEIIDTKFSACYSGILKRTEFCYVITYKTYIED